MMARSTARRRKHIKAGEGAAEAAESLLGKMQAAGQWGNRARNRRGQLEAYEERSNSRDAEGVQSAKLAELQLPRMKNGKAYVNPETGEVSSLAGEAARFALRKEALEDEQKGMMGDERKKIIDRAKPDMEQAAADSDQVREQRKSAELLKAEEAEKSAQKTFRESEAKIKVDVDAEIKKDEGGIIAGAQKELDEAKKNEKLVDTGLVKLKQDADYSKLAEDREERKKADEAKKRIEEQLKKTEGLTDADKDKLEKKKQAEEAKIAKFDASILANTRGVDVEKDVKEKEEEKQTAKNAAEKAQKKIKERTEEIAGNVEKKAVTSDGTTVAQQRDAYTKAQAKTIEAKKAWEQTLTEAEKSPTTTVTSDERERAKAMQDVLQQVSADVESKIKKDETIVKAKETLTDQEKEVAKDEETLKELKAKKLAVAPPSSPEEKTKRAEAKAQLEADDKLGKYKGQSVDELLKELYEKHGWSQDKDAENRVFVQAYMDASKEEQNTSLDAQITTVEKDIAQKRGNVTTTSKAIDERREQITKETEAKPVQIAGEEAPVPIEQLRKENAEAQKKVAVADQLERDRVAKEKLEKIESNLFKGELVGPDGEPVMANGKPVKRSDSNIAIAYLKAKQRAATTSAGVEAAETDAQKIMLGLESFHSLFSSEVASKMGAEASKAFLDGIKEQKTGELFKKGALELQAALEKGGASLEKLSLKNVGARMAQAQMISEYNKDISGAHKREAADHAESIFTVERYGFKTPSSAFKDWVKKQTERLQGVEREQSVKNAMGTVSQFFKLQEQGKEISTDQRAQMMAHLKHLTSNGWMDDLLAGIAKKSTMKASLFGEEREEAEALESVFINRLHWDPNDNRSGADRTAQVQKLVAMGGDNDNMQGEELNLWIMENTGKTYSEANKQAAAVTHENAKIILDEKTTRDAKAQIAIKAGALTEDQLAKAKADPKDFKANAAVDAGIDQLMAYTRKFALPAESAEKAAEAFMKSTDKFQEAFEMLADFKNLGMNTGHIDDGGHTYYDMAEGKVRGNLGHRGKEFTLGEWRKLGLDQRLSRLKTHSVGQMQEDYQTIDYTSGEESDDAIRETFAGLSNQREFAKVDGRNKDHIAGMASGEAIRQDAGGRTKIGDDDSVYFKGTFSHIADQDERRKAVAKRLRGNYAAFLRNNPAALFGSLAERGGLSFDDGMEGKINVNVCGETISSVEELVRWVNSDPDGKFRFNPERIRSSLARAQKSRKNDD